MAAISIGDALGEGFNLIRTRPVAVLTWGAARTVFSVGTVAALAPFYLSLFGQILTRAQTGVATPPDLASMMQFQGLSSLLSLAGAFLGTVLYCAVLRSVLHPEQRRFAYLRIGAPEFLLFLLTFGASIVIFIALFAAFIPVGVVIAIAAVSHAPGVGILLAVVIGIAAIVLLFWLAFRFALVGPMTVQDGKFHLFDAWTLSRGHSGALILIALCLVVILFVVGAVFGAILIGLGLGLVGQAAGGLQNLHAFFSQSPAAILSGLLPALSVAAVLQVPFSGCSLAIMAAPWARAYLDVAPPDVAATFA